MVQNVAYIFYEKRFHEKIHLQHLPDRNFTQQSTNLPHATNLKMTTNVDPVSVDPSGKPQAALLKKKDQMGTKKSIDVRQNSSDSDDSDDESSSNDNESAKKEGPPLVEFNAAISKIRYDVCKFYEFVILLKIHY
jgi:hypothetical protein